MHQNSLLRKPLLILWGICALTSAFLNSPNLASAFQTEKNFRKILEMRLDQANDQANDQTKQTQSPPNPQPPQSVEQNVDGSDPIWESTFEPNRPGDLGSEAFQRTLGELDAALNCQAPVDSVQYFESHAIANHPRIQSLLHEIEALRAESLQQSLRPNPRLAVFGDEIFNEDKAGLLGARITQTNVPERQLRTRARAKCAEAERVMAQVAIVRQRIVTDVRGAFYEVLIAQRQRELADQLTTSYLAAIQKLEKLAKVGEATRTDVLQLEVQYQQAVARLGNSTALYYSAWRRLAALIGDETMTEQDIDGSLDVISAPLDFNVMLAELVQFSPEIEVANSNIRQAKAILEREIARAKPITQTQWTVGRDSVTDDFFTGVQYTVPLQKYDRNQGNISAAHSRLAASYQQAELLPRQLANRLAREFQSYDAASFRAQIYLNEILPKSRKAVEMVGAAFESGEANFLQLLTAQQTLINATSDYLAALRTVWSSRQKIEGLLLSGSLDENN